MSYLAFDNKRLSVLCHPVVERFLVSRWTDGKVKEIVRPRTQKSEAVPIVELQEMKLGGDYACFLFQTKLYG